MYGFLFLFFFLAANKLQNLRIINYKQLPLLIFMAKHYTPIIYTNQFGVFYTFYSVFWL